ncbi:MAG: S9 family peptidase [Chitinophagaceae bacterium]|nr:MAG: S9 family peptidase [Chitinophagaceae bacterium]
MYKTFLLALLLAGGTVSNAQELPGVKGNYQLASRYSTQHLSKMVFSLTVEPHWLKASGRFWYEFETPQGKNWYIVDPATKSKQALLDKIKLAAKITRLTGRPYDAQHLPVDSLRFSADEKTLVFCVKNPQPVTGKPAKPSWFSLVLATGDLGLLVDMAVQAPPLWASISPDGESVAFAREHNLYLMDRANYLKALKNPADSSIVEKKLTENGVVDFSYESIRRGETDGQREKKKRERRPAGIYWAPDSRHFYLVRADERLISDLWVIHSITEGRPQLETYKYQMAGEKETPQKEMVLFDVTAGTHKVVATSGYKDQELTSWRAVSPAYTSDDPVRPVIWLGTNNKFYFTRTSRDLKNIDLCSVDVQSGTVTPVIREHSSVYIDTASTALVNGGEELIYRSEEDGWSHFYLYDGKGKLKNQITSGEYHCADVVRVDEKNRWLYFLANGREVGEDPYYLHLYKVKFDGSGLTLLNKGDFDHAVSMNDNQSYFVDNFSRVNTVPESVLYDNNGKKVMDLEKADLSALFAAGYRFPTPYKVKADDGITDLFGVMYTPFDLDSTKSYPIIEFVYPGPQTEYVNKSWTSDTRYPAGVFTMDRTARLAQLGFVVVTIGNRGGHPSRSKWYHTFGYGNLRDYGLADKKAAVEQLADRYRFIDIKRVGITGRSGGGFMSTAAMLVYPDFFKVAVAEVGNHENNIYNRWWSEKHHGVQETISSKGDTTYQYNVDKNPALAANLKGRLLLAIGDIDNNVHPAGTIRMANSLIKAGKRFDFVMMPNERHIYSMSGTEYFFYMMGDYFVKHLLGDFSQPVDMLELQREWPLTGRPDSQ